MPNVRSQLPGGDFARSLHPFLATTPSYWEQARKIRKMRQLRQRLGQSIYSDFKKNSETFVIGFMEVIVQVMNIILW